MPKCSRQGTAFIIFRAASITALWSWRIPVGPIPLYRLAQFLAGWRLTTTGIGSMAGPLLISAITAVAPLAAACVAMGAVGWLGAAWLWRWTAPPPVR